MRTPCESIVTAILPAFRSLVAKELVENLSLSQLEVAHKLGITQAAVSQYLSHKRGNQLIEMLESLPEVRSAVLNVAANIAKTKSSGLEAMMAFCSLCGTLKQESVACMLHHDALELPQNCRICHE